MSRHRMSISHYCGAAWSGRHCAHCNGCHRTFSSDSGWEKHRQGPHPRTCLDPATLLDKQRRPVFTTRVDGAGCTIWVLAAYDYDAHTDHTARAAAIAEFAATHDEEVDQ